MQDGRPGRGSRGLCLCGGVFFVVEVRVLSISPECKLSLISVVSDGSSWEIRD
jgi:hypothetical protein